MVTFVCGYGVELSEVDRDLACTVLSSVSRWYPPKDPFLRSMLTLSTARACRKPALVL